ncbi:beta-catenin-like protein 1 [Theileria parva strain Muguga]|uniref:beta-catenin-like protein 1 n=1 Tax=Theileria parva strain Muguga TaxID=333668 RepID=UPI001C618538|nr:beta-catenin-like protein 1 [Theileria parva strain Muguga]EAN32696.2 beta-catenin-like protein 1 [Theileria parva strain Muguga]
MESTNGVAGLSNNCPPREPLSASNIKRNVNLLLKRYETNQNDRISHPDNPQKWVMSEVDLDEQIRFFGDLSTMPSLYREFLLLDGFRILSNMLTHDNIDIGMSCINVLSEILDPEIIFSLENPHDFTTNLELLSLHSLVVNTLLLIQEVDEVDYNGVKSSFELLENLMELSPTAVNDLAKDKKFLSYLLTRMKNRKTMAYDTNRVYASEILCILLQGSEDCVAIFGAKEPLDGIDQLLRIVSVYRKRDPECLEEEELVENAFQALCRLMFNPENQLRFGKIQGIQLMIRLIREGRRTYKSALKLLDFALLDSPQNCQLFVQLCGLGYVFGVFMRKGFTTTENSEQEKQEDENVIGIINSLVMHCTGQESERVLTKFRENRHEKLERLVELHDKYTQKSKQSLEKLDRMNHTELNGNGVTGDDNYLEKYDAGLSICQLIACLIIRVYNMKYEVGLCLLLLIKNKGVDIQDIYNHLLDYLEHLSEEGQELKKEVEDLTVKFLRGAKEFEKLK